MKDQGPAPFRVALLKSAGPGPRIASMAERRTYASCSKTVTATGPPCSLRCLCPDILYMGVIPYSFSQKQPFAALSRTFRPQHFLKMRIKPLNVWLEVLLGSYMVRGLNITYLVAVLNPLRCSCVRWLNCLLVCRMLLSIKACSYSFFETRTRAFHRSPSGQPPSRAMCAFRANPFCNICPGNDLMDIDGQ